MSAWAAFPLQLPLLQMQMACGLGCALMNLSLYEVISLAVLSAVMQHVTEVLVGTFFPDLLPVLRACIGGHGM